MARGVEIKKAKTIVKLAALELMRKRYRRRKRAPYLPAAVDPVRPTLTSHPHARN
jgi:hypothetical protein